MIVSVSLHLAYNLFYIFKKILKIIFNVILKIFNYVYSIYDKKFNLKSDDEKKTDN